MHGLHGYARGWQEGEQHGAYVLVCKRMLLALPFTLSLASCACCSEVAAIQG